LLQIGAIHDGFLKNEAWITRAKVIARLPGLSDEVKVAAMLLGPEHIFAQTLLLQSIALHKRSPDEAIMAFFAYMKACGFELWDITGWVTSLVFTGAFKLEDPSALNSIEGLNEMEITEMGHQLAAHSAVYLSAFMSGLLSLKPKMESYGIEFREDLDLITNAFTVTTTDTDF
jgi:hypothetical protein